MAKTFTSLQIKAFQAKGFEGQSIKRDGKTVTKKFEYSVNLRYNKNEQKFSIRVSNVWVYAFEGKDGSIRLQKSAKRYDNFKENSKWFAEEKRDRLYSLMKSYLLKIGFTKLTWQELLDMAKENGFDTDIAEKVVSKMRDANAKEKAERLAKKEAKAKEEKIA